MLSFTSLQSNSILYSCYGQFLSPTEMHLVLVKPHSISYYLASQLYNNSEPDLELSFETTISSAYTFLLPSHKCQTIALLSEDFTLIILTAPLSQENPDQISEEDGQDSPIEETFCDQIRIAHVIPTSFSPLFASSGNQLFISVYPNSLCVVTFNQNSSSFVLEKNEIHFLKYLPSFLYGDPAHQQLISIDTRDNTIKHIELTQIQTALEQQSYDSSSLLFSKSESLEQEIEYFYFAAGHLLLITKEKIIIHDQCKSFDLVNHSGISTVHLNHQETGLYLSFQDGDFSLFDLNSHKFTHIQKLKPYKIITPIENNKLLLTSPTEKAVIFDPSSKSVFNIFPNQISNLVSMTTLDQQVIMADNRFLHSIGLGFYVTPSTIVNLNAERLFSVEQTTVVSTHNSTIILDSKSGEDISNNSSFETKQSTLYFCSYNSDWLLQFCPHKIVAFHKAAKEIFSYYIEIQHAVTANKTIIVASNSLSFIQFDGHQFQVIRSIDFSDEISSMSTYKDKFLILSTWRNLTVFVYDIESGNKLSERQPSLSGMKYVVRSICEVSNHIFFGTSRGDIICTEFDDSTGTILVYHEKHLSTSTIALSKISFENTEYLCVCSDKTYFIRLLDNHNIEIHPSNLGNTSYISQTCGNSAVLANSSVIFGQLEKGQIQFNQKELESPIQKVTTADSDTIIALLANKVLVIDALFFDIVKEIQLDPQFNYTNMNFFTMNKDKYIVLCAGKQQIEENKFSENGSILLVKNYNEILTPTVKMNGLPTTAIFSNNSLYICSGPFISKYSISPEMVFTLIKESPCIMLASDLIVTEHNVIVIDAFKSVSMFDLDLQKMSTDFCAKYLVSGCRVSDSSLLVSDSRGCVYSMNVAQNRIVVQSQMNLGETVTALSKWTHLDDIQCDVYIGITSKGSIQSFITGIDNALFESMEKLQNELETFLVKNGELSHFNYRAIYSPAYRESYEKYVDVTFLIGFQDLEDDDKAEIIAKSGITNADSIFELINSISKLNVQ